MDSGALTILEGNEIVMITTGLIFISSRQCTRTRQPPHPHGGDHRPTPPPLRLKPTPPYQIRVGCRAGRSVGTTPKDRDRLRVQYCVHPNFKEGGVLLNLLRQPQWRRKIAADGQGGLHVSTPSRNRARFSMNLWPGLRGSGIT
jgi:hypothetical protein